MDGFVLCGRKWRSVSSVGLMVLLSVVFWGADQDMFGLCSFLVCRWKWLVSWLTIHKYRKGQLAIEETKCLSPKTGGEEFWDLFGRRASQFVCGRPTMDGLDFKCPPPHGIPHYEYWRFVSVLQMDLLYLEYFGSTSSHSTNYSWCGWWIQDLIVY